nr:hypothetical protein [Actinacidiphila oryziradicis]
MGQVTGFERGQVPVDPCLCCGQLLVHGVELVLDVLLSVRTPFGCGGDGLGDHVGVRVGVEQRLQDGLFELFGGEAVGGAAALAVAPEGEAGVVPVPVFVPCRRCPHVPLPAAVAGDPSGEQVGAAVGGSAGVVVAAGGDDLLCLFEDLRVDEGGVRVVGPVPGAAEVDLAEVGAVAQDYHDAGAAPALAVLGSVSALVEFLGQSSRPHAGVDVQVEDDRDEWCLTVHRGEHAGGGVQFVAVGPVAAAPLAACGLSFHAVDDAVDNGLSLELGEDAEHLHQHPADRRRGVEGFCGRPEGSP